MSRSEQRGPLLDGTFDVLELAVPELEAAGHQRTGAWTTMPTARSARAITNARMTVRPAAMRSGSFIGFARSRSNTHAESSPRGTATTRAAISHTRWAAPPPHGLGWTLMTLSITPPKA